MAQLVIRGHKTRGKEVIKLLEMLGGKTSATIYGDLEFCGYYINSSGCIDCKHHSDFNTDAMYFLEEFLEKFPYKVGDKVSSTYLKNYKLGKMEWEDCNNRVIYKLQGMGWYSAEELQPYKEQENMEEQPLLATTTETEGYYLITKEQINSRSISTTTEESKIMFDKHVTADKVELVLGDDYEVKQDGDKWFVVKKQPQYPQTYKECCTIVGNNFDENDVVGYQWPLLVQFQMLLICRNAYWKMAGDLKPDWTDNHQKKYTICYYQGEVNLTNGPNVHVLLAFPTEEMRDAFYENFKNIIEVCKDLL